MKQALNDFNFTLPHFIYIDNEPITFFYFTHYLLVCTQSSMSFHNTVEFLYMVALHFIA